MLNAIHAQQLQIITFNWFTYFVAVNYTASTHSPSSGKILFFEIFEIFHKYNTKYFMKYFTPKNLRKFYINNYDTHLEFIVPGIVYGSVKTRKPS